VTIANAADAVPSPLPPAPEPVPITHAPPPAPQAPTPLVAHVAAPEPAPAPVPVPAAAPARPVYRAVSPAKPVTVKQLDAALVAYLDLGPAAREIQATLAEAGLRPPPYTGTEAVARLLRLRFDHPAAQDGLELLPNQSVTRAEAAYSLAQVVRLHGSDSEWARSVADSFTLPALDGWQTRILATAIHYVGYPYVWGGTSPTAEAPFGVHSAGGFDCSGFVWQVYKLTSYDGERDLAGVLRGRTTYVMSGEVPRSERIGAGKLQPGDVMFFGTGPHSKPSQVDHTAIYLGNGWFVQSSGEGVTLLPFDGWYRTSFAWARRPLREAGLSR
jgi:cell wall-associated NlpC family hydrolase